MPERFFGAEKSTIKFAGPLQWNQNGHPLSSSDVWDEAVRAIRLNSDEPCPVREFFCDNCPGGNYTNVGCDWPEYAPGEDLLRINFTSPDGDTYPGYENVTHETAFPALCGLEGTIPCGWLDTTGLESSVDWNADPDDERFNSWVGYDARGAGSRTFRMVVEPGEYFVEIGTSPWLGGSLAVISVNGVWYWNEEYFEPAETVDEIDDVRIVKQQHVTTTPEGYIDISIGGAAGSSPFDTLLSYVRLRAAEDWGGGGGASLIGPEGEESQYLVASAPETGEGRAVLQVAAAAVRTAEASDQVGGPPQTLGWLEARVRRGAVLVDGEAPVALVMAPAPDRLVGQLTPSVTVQWLHVDHLGSTRLVTDETGFEVSRHKFLPFGQEIDTSDPTAPNTHGFTGHEGDGSTRSAYMLARYSSENSSRFLSRDPGFDAVVIQTPKTWNSYAYAYLNPVRYVDPDGRFGFDAHVLIGVFNDMLPREAEGVAEVDGPLGIDAVFRKENHFGDNEKLTSLIDAAAEAEVNGDPKAKRLKEEAEHLSDDQVAHEGVGWLEHGLREFADWFRPGCKFSPDCEDSEGYNERFWRAVEKRAETDRRIEEAIKKKRAEKIDCRYVPRFRGDPNLNPGNIRDE